MGVAVDDAGHEEPIRAVELRRAAGRGQVGAELGDNTVLGEHIDRAGKVTALVHHADAAQQ